MPCLAHWRMALLSIEGNTVTRPPYSFGDAISIEKAGCFWWDPSCQSSGQKSRTWTQQSKVTELLQCRIAPRVGPCLLRAPEQALHVRAGGPEQPPPVPTPGLFDTAALLGRPLGPQGRWQGKQEAGEVEPVRLGEVAQCKRPGGAQRGDVEQPCRPFRPPPRIDLGRGLGAELECQLAAHPVCAELPVDHGEQGLGRPRRT